MTNQELNKWVWSKHNLIRKLDRDEITQEEYNSEMIEVEKKIKEEQDKIIESKISRPFENKNELEEQIKMEEQQKKEKSITRGNSNAQLILEALQLKSVKNYNDVAFKVKEKKPEVDEKKIASQAKIMVREIIAGKGAKSKAYQWDAENFLLVKKQ